MSVISYLRTLKNNHPFFLYLWTKNRQRIGKKQMKKYDDKQAIINLYHSYSGRYPDLENPETFSEKMQWLKLNYKNDLMTICADKLEVRNYLKEKGYENLLSKTLGVYDKISDLNIPSLPQKFVLKATHGSGWNLIVEDKARINWFIWKKIMNIWLHDNIFWPGREWPYRKMKPRLMAEEYMEDNSGKLMDYKFFCFNGKAHFVQANKGRGTNNHAQNFYNLDWKILPFGKNLEPRPDIEIKPPLNLHEMTRIAEDLATSFPFVRVDFYEVNRKVIFGEMTFYPKSGLPDFCPLEYDQKLGDLLQIELT